MRILFVAMSESIHVARWLSQLSDLGWDLHIYSSTNNLTINPGFKNVTIYKPFYSYQKKIDRTVKIIGIPVLLELLIKIGNKGINILFPKFHQFWLKRIINRIKPDIIHSMEFQSAGYLTCNVKKLGMEYFPPWIATNWGSDIYLYRHDADHVERIKEILTSCNYYSCECERDVRLAKELGLTGKVLPVVPNAGGFDIEYLAQFQESGNVSQRKLILIKGYHGWAGRALIALEAIALCSEELAQYTIALYNTSEIVEQRIKSIKQSTGLNIQIIRACPYIEMIKKFGKARIYIGLSISDAISTSLLEAMVMGAFPIQSDTSCAEEWIQSNESGIIVHPENVEKCADAIRIALRDDKLVDRASHINYQIACKRLDKSIIQPQAIEIYESIMNESKLICVNKDI